MLNTRELRRIEIRRRHLRGPLGASLDNLTWGMWFTVSNTKYRYGPRERYATQEDAMQAAKKRMVKLVKETNSSPEWAKRTEYALVNVVEHIAEETLENYLNERL